MFKRPVVMTVVACLVVAGLCYASAPKNVNVTLTGPTEGFAEDPLGYSANGSYELDQETQEEMDDDEASVSVEYSWGYAPASCETPPAEDSNETFKFAEDDAPGQYTISVTYTVTVTYADGTSDSQLAIDSIDVEIVPDLTLTVSTDRTDICAGAVNSDAHKALITATVADGHGDPIQGKSISFSIENSAPAYPATCAPQQGTTGANGCVTATITSSAKVGATATVIASCEGEQVRSDEISMAKPADHWTIDPSVVLADGESTASVTLTLGFDGVGVEGHELTWRLHRIWDAFGNLVYTVDPQSGSPNGYGSLGAGPDTTSGDGTAYTTYTAGTEAGTIEFEALDQTVVESSPGSYTSGEDVVRPTKVDVRRIWTQGTQDIAGFDSTVYEATYNQGQVEVLVEERPLANEKDSFFGVSFELMTWPEGAAADVEWKTTWHLLAGSVVKETGEGDGVGLSGAYNAQTPNCIGAYVFKEQFTLRDAGDWKGSLVEHSDAYMTYSEPKIEPACSDGDFSAQHLARVCSLAQGTQDLSATGPYSVPRKLQSQFAGASHYEAETTYSVDEHWEMIMGVRTGDCDDWAKAHMRALALLGIQADWFRVRAYNQQNDACWFTMLPNGTGPWNYHAVSKVDATGHCYSLTQSNYPVGSETQMKAHPPDQDRLVIDEVRDPL